ncbi:hypothetical protein BCR34DRAFT_601218 [Clohesyomyces aquaticus]|uniref:Homeobox domain-containing protein n=1 Tax=Clohesyomyces aquaticus TaxID=1231657 RepID=A0A1Y1ZMX9_9PLEO|nr:hypothetical protein BCR34DRAFT_601218 [Clohesyomyces aquaticus]
MEPPSSSPSSLEQRGCLPEDTTLAHLDKNVSASKEKGGISTPGPTGDRYAKSNESLNLAQTSHQTFGKDGDIIAQLTRGSIELFAALLRPPSKLDYLTTKTVNILRRDLSTLKLWANGHGALNGRLDLILEKSKCIQQTTLATLFSLSGVLSNRLSKILLVDSEKDRCSLLTKTNVAATREQARRILLDFDRSNSESEIDSDEGNESDLDSLDEGVDVPLVDMVFDDIKTDIQCLVDLNIALECPAPDPRHELRAQGPGVEKRQAYDYYTDLIIAKFPRAGIEVAQCLGKANWHRYQRIQEERVKNMPSHGVIAEEIPKSRVDSSDQLRPYAFQLALTSLPFPFNSDILSGQRVKIPPLPTEAQLGQAFRCAACGKHLPAISNDDWRKHLFSDLRPYTCLHTNCSFSAMPFPNRPAWSAHLGHDHGLGPDWKSKECPLCLEPTGDGEDTILAHLGRHMEDIAIAALPDSNEDIEHKKTAPTDKVETSASFTKVSPNAEAADVKPRLSKEQYDILEAYFQTQHKPTTTTKKGIAEALGVPCDKINNWFQNRRAKFKQDQRGVLNQIAMDMNVFPTGTERSFGTEEVMSSFYAATIGASHNFNPSRGLNTAVEPVQLITPPASISSISPSLAISTTKADSAGVVQRTPPPNTTLPGTTLPGTTLPGTTLPGTTLPGTTLPGTTLPGTTLPTPGPLASYSNLVGESQYSACTYSDKP